MNIILLIMVGVAFVFAGWHQFSWIPMPETSTAVELAASALFDAKSMKVIAIYGPRRG